MSYSVIDDPSLNKLATDSVDTAKIVNSSVTLDKLAANSVDTTSH